ncbi:hypothetical protein LTR62_001696 [Meristemomyces frigidus]|uniref:Glucose-methanol-choline oxidoreductase N-terminal domain-containing protein n=1 Tax=Meristemomyces frigidus TaxID=1508187 RepID=A0AAN7YBF2_9PEZI|nr:hypothetical protein LTR62_001696 [Meristemomyces frigidus]
MKTSQFSAAVILAGASIAVAQIFAPYTDSGNGIEFWQASFGTTLGENTAEFGLALPSAAESNMTNEYIGRLVVPKVSTGTWMGLSHMSEMTDSLLLVTWVNNGDILTSFRYASGYVAPDIYSGNATLTPISSNVNNTHYELTYRCENCWSWDQDGAAGSQVPATTTGAAQLIGWAQATNAPTNPGEADSGLQQHDNDGIFGALVASARNSAYTDWVTMASTTAVASATAIPYPTGNSTVVAGATGTGAVATATATAAPVACPTNNTLAGSTWDYIIVGAGAGGIPLADKLSEQGASVLLVERGPPSSGRWGGSMKPDWLNGTNLTRFDVPGLDNEIWKDSAGIACEDYSVMAGCVLGGGTAVNAGLWWRANPEDFDYNFPAGWKSSDMEPAVDRVFERIPFTDRPSMDGVLYKPQGYNIVAGALAAAGWSNVTADNVPGKKNMTFSHPNEMFSHGERGGPMATYLVTASTRKNFKLIMNTAVDRLVRNGGLVIGVSTSAYLAGGQCGTILVTPGTGKVILAAGAFGTPKILFRSGIGPQDQLEVVQQAEGSAMINSSQWINLPVGYNLDDHTNTDVVITHPNVSFYDFYGAYDNPIKADAASYLVNRTGILAQSAPNLAVVAWQEINGDDGIIRQLQWTARVEGGDGITSNQSMVISQYLGRGATSRGRTTINGGLDMTVSQVPYLQNTHDLAAVKAGVQSLIQSLSTDPAIKIQFPPSNQTLDEWLAAYPLTTSKRSANHWMGSCKMGLDSGLVNNGSSVVDTNAKVYGTNNLFVVDASIFPGMVSNNPSALIVAVAERAAELIPKVVVGSITSTVVNATLPSSSAAYGNGTSTSGAGLTSTNATVLPVSTGCTITITRSSTMTSSVAGASVTAPSTMIASSGSATSVGAVLTSSPSFPTLNSTSTLAVGTGPASLVSPLAPTGSATSGGAIAEWGRCGGNGYTGSTTCATGLCVQASAKN